MSSTSLVTSMPRTLYGVFLLTTFLISGCSTQQVARNAVSIAKVPAKAATSVARTAGSTAGGVIGGTVGGNIGRRIGSAAGRTAAGLATGNP